MIKVSVITVVFNSLEALRKTMRSVEMQDYDNIEYIVVDGGSEDGTSSFLADYKGKLTKWVSEPDKGIYDAMNKGIGMATGDACIFMNAGDTFVETDTVSRAVAMGAGTTDVVYGDIMKNGNRIIAKSPRNCHRMYYCHQSAFTSTECLREYPFDITHKMSADFKQAKQLFLAGKSFRHIDLVVADFDTSGISNTSRSKGLWDNITVICETDDFADKCKLLPRLWFTYILCKLRGK